MADTGEVERLMSLACDLSDAGRAADAEGAFLTVAKLVPEWSVPWYELGLLCKYQGRWAESLDYNRRAAELDPSDDASWWNMGIAATAVADWTAARLAWSRCGINLPDGDGPPEADFGLVPVRLRPDDHGEVVWARRIDPARARIENVPLPASQYRWRDLVLHDGAAEGYRILEGREVPVFNVLARLDQSAFQTFILELGSSDETAIEMLESVALRMGGAAENWGTSTRILCRECSLGTPHVHVASSEVSAYPHCGIAAHDKHHAGAIVDAWLAQSAEVDLVRWYSGDDG